MKCLLLNHWAPSESYRVIVMQRWPETTEMGHPLHRSRPESYLRTQPWTLRGCWCLRNKTKGSGE